MESTSSNDIQPREQWVKPEVQVFDAKKDINAKIGTGKDLGVFLS
ncbi:MAG: hypothetical protein M0Z50_19000 [Planctomycetia bacterium]|nr:hypothetical protein [Planctomycetia bacterium]